MLPQIRDIFLHKNSTHHTISVLVNVITSVTIFHYILVLCIGWTAVFSTNNYVMKKTFIFLK